MIQRFVVVFCALVLVSLTGASASAGEGGGKAPVPSSIVLHQSNPYLGEWIDFVTTYPGTVKNPRVIVNCYQNDALVWGEVGLVTDSFKLGGDSSPWVEIGGPASCYADLENLIWHGHNMQEWDWLAGADFEVTG